MHIRALSKVFLFCVLCWVAEDSVAQTATSTTLTVTAAGAPALGVSAHTAISLTASVSAGLHIVRPGQVRFCDASSPSCTGSHLLGLAQVTPSGTAVFTFVPGPGIHTYKASFVGTNTYAPSVSPPQSLTVTAVTGPLSTNVGVLASGGQGDYALLGTVATNGLVPPTGQVTFLDTSNSNYLLSTTQLGSTGPTGITFRNSYTFLGAPYSAQCNCYGDTPITADFNGDGIPDILIVEAATRTIYLLTGKGDGTFSSSVVLTLPRLLTGTFAVGDFNGDGKMDFLVQTSLTQVVTYLGNGDGTFVQGPTSSPFGSTAIDGFGAMVADLDGDGIPDLLSVTADPGSSTEYLQVSKGNGDGSFAPLSVRTLLPYGADNMVLGDFNNDGKVDVAVSNIGPGSNTQVFLANGDGTFRALPAILNGIENIALVATDLNGDGNIDLVVTNQSQLPAAVLLGKGDGTFTELPADQNLLQQSQAIAVADFNGDGIPDLIFPNEGGGYTSVFIGKGDGTFSPDAFSPAIAGSQLNRINVADYNGDGQSDILEAFSYDLFDGDPKTQISVLLSQGTNTTAGYAYNISPVGTGYHYIVATYPGDANNASGISSPVALLAEQVPTVLSLTANPSGGGAIGQAVTLTATLDRYFAQNHYASGTVSFFNGTKTIGSGNVNNGVATFTTSSLPSGTAMLSALYPGDINFETSTSGTLSYPVTQPRAQTITFPQVTMPAYAGTAQVLTASSSSGLPITYTVVSGPATVNGSILTLTGAGTVTVEADQAGGSGYLAASAVKQNIATVLLTEPVGISSGPIVTAVTFANSGTLANVAFLTQGTPNLDFSRIQLGTVNAALPPCSAGTTYIAGQSCLASFSFTPTVPGARFGGLVLTSGAGVLLANSYIYGVGVGPQVNYLPGTKRTFSGGFAGPAGLAIDGSGNLFVADVHNNAVKELTSASGYASTVTIATGLIGATALAVDGSGNLFVVQNNGVQQVTEFYAVGGYANSSVVAKGFVQPSEIAVDGNGNLFVADYGAKTVSEYFVATGYGTSVRLAGTYSYPVGVAIDASSNVFVADFATGKLTEVPSSGAYTSSIQLPGNYSFVQSLAVNPSGDLFVGSQAGGFQEVFAAGGYSKTVTLDTNQQVAGIALDGKGNLFYSDFYGQAVNELNYATPPMLTFAPTPVGSTSKDSPQTVTEINNGTADLMFAVPITGRNPSITTGFNLDTASTCPQFSSSSSTGTLAVGAACTNSVSFSPVAGGVDQGALVTSYTNLGIGNTQTVLLNGVGTTTAPAIVFTVPNHTFGDLPFPVSASSNSGGVLTYLVVSGPATISGSIVTLTGVGTVTLQASQASSGPYAAGTQTAVFMVYKASQTILFAQPSSPVALSSNAITLSATASSGLPVTFSVVSGPATVAVNTLTLTGIGTVVVAADQAGNTNFLAAPEVLRTVVVIGRAVTVTLTATPNPVFVGNPLTLLVSLAATGGTPTGTVVFLDGSNPLGTAAVSGSSAMLVTSGLTLGIHSITAIYSGDGVFAQLASSPVLVTVQDFALTSTNPSVTISHGGTATYNLVLSSVGGIGMASTVHLAVSGAPDRSEIIFTPQDVPVGNGTTSVSLVIHTPNYPTGPFSVAGLKVPGEISFALLCFGSFLLPFRSKLKAAIGGKFGGLLLVCLGVGCTVCATGCGSGWRTQKWTMQVTASSGQLTRTTTLILTSQCADGRVACPIENQ